MIDPIFRTETKVTFGPCRLSYVHLLAPYKFKDDQGDGKYSCIIMVPKSEKKTVAALQKAIEAAAVQGTVSRWGGKRPKKMDSPLRDGDEKDNEAFEDMYILNAKSNRRPNVVDKNMSPITSEDDIYSGVWAYVCVSFYPFDSNGSKGVAVAIDSVRKYKDDERFSGGSSVESDFAGLPEDDDEDL